MPYELTFDRLDDELNRIRPDTTSQPFVISIIDVFLFAPVMQVKDTPNVLMNTTIRE